MAAQITVYRMGRGRVTLPFDKSRQGPEGATAYLKDAGVNPGKGTILVDNIDANGTDFPAKIEPGSVISVAATKMDSGHSRQ